MRWYDQSLGRFIQPDTLVPNPGDPVAFDRYHYSRNSPLVYVDPSGHGACSGPYYVPECEEIDQNGDGVVVFNPVTALPIEDSDLRKMTREVRAADLLRWLTQYEGPSWWGDELTLTEIIAFILYEEGSTLPYEEQKNMVRGIRAFIEDNDLVTMLAAMTGFINPDGAPGFTRTDWDELINPPESMDYYIRIVESVTDSNRNYKFWFTEAELIKSNVTIDEVRELAAAYGGTVSKAIPIPKSFFYFTNVGPAAWCATGSGSCTPPDP